MYLFISKIFSLILIRSFEIFVTLLLSLILWHLIKILLLWHKLILHKLLLLKLLLRLILRLNKLLFNGVKLLWMLNHSWMWSMHNLN